MVSAFSVKLVGSFYSSPLLDDAGRECLSIESAVRAAESQFGEDWGEVYNGYIGASRNEWQAGEGIAADIVVGDDGVGRCLGDLV